MSGITYPYLHDSPAPPLAVEADDVEESFSVAPAAPVDERHGEKQAMSAQHLSLCALCGRVLAAPYIESRVLFFCKHAAHAQCFISRANEKKMPNSGLIGGIFHCNHCIEISIKFGTQASEENDCQAFDEAMQRLRHKHRQQFTRIKPFDVVISEPLTEEMVYGMLGTRPPGAPTILGGLKTRFGALVNRTEEQTIYNSVPIPQGDEFVAALRERKRNLNNILQTLQYQLGHVYNAGVVTMEQLYAIGFDSRAHLLPDMRAAIPLHELVERYGFTASADLKSLNNEQLIACFASRDEIRLVKLRAAELVARKVTFEQLRGVGMTEKPHVSIEGWIEAAGIEMPHAISMGFTAQKLLTLKPKEGTYTMRLMNELASV